MSLYQKSFNKPLVCTSIFDTQSDNLELLSSSDLKSELCFKWNTAMTKVSSSVSKGG